MRLPPSPSPGAPLEASWGRAVIDYLRSITPRNSTSILANVGPNGTTFEPLTASKKNASTPTATHPYQGVDVSVGASPKVKVRIGSHSDIVPKVYGTPLTADLDDSPEIALSAGEGFVYVECTVDETSRLINDVLINYSMGPAALTNTDTTCYQTLFWFSATVESGSASVVIAQNITHSQWHQYCAGSHLFGLV